MECRKFLKKKCVKKNTKNNRTPGKNYGYFRNIYLRNIDQNLWTKNKLNSDAI